MASGGLIYTSRVFPNGLLSDLRNDSSTFEAFETLDHFGAQRAFLALTKRKSKVYRYVNPQAREKEIRVILSGLRNPKAPRTS
jgi:hypothetical protein